MTTALIAACFSGILRTAGIIISVIISAEFFYFLLFAKTTEEKIENHHVNPYHFRNTTKLIAQALSFIFFIQPGNDRFTIWAGRKSAASGNRVRSFSDRMPFSFCEKNNSTFSGRNDFSVSDPLNFSNADERFFHSGNATHTINVFSTIRGVNFYSFIVRRKVVTEKLFTNPAMQNLTTCL